MNWLIQPKSEYNPQGCDIILGWICASLCLVDCDFCLLWIYEEPDNKF